MSTVRKEEGGTEETPTQEKGVWTRQEAGGMNWEIGTDKDVGEFVISSVLSRHNKNLK